MRGSTYAQERPLKMPLLLLSGAWERGCGKEAFISSFPQKLPSRAPSFHYCDHSGGKERLHFLVALAAHLPEQGSPRSPVGCCSGRTACLAAPPFRYGASGYVHMYVRLYVHVRRERRRSSCPFLLPGEILVKQSLKSPHIIFHGRVSRG